MSKVDEKKRLINTFGEIVNTFARTIQCIASRTYSDPLEYKSFMDVDTDEDSNAVFTSKVDISPEPSVDYYGGMIYYDAILKIIVDVTMVEEKCSSTLKVTNDYTDPVTVVHLTGKFSNIYDFIDIIKRKIFDEFIVNGKKVLCPPLVNNFDPVPNRMLSKLANKLGSVFIASNTVFYKSGDKYYGKSMFEYTSDVGIFRSMFNKNRQKIVYNTIYKHLDDDCYMWAISICEEVINEALDIMLNEYNDGNLSYYDYIDHVSCFMGVISGFIGTNLEVNNIHIIPEVIRVMHRITGKIIDSGVLKEEK